jgi:YHS domain-containing protein
MAKSQKPTSQPNRGVTQMPQVFKDPVCGMEVGPQKSYSATHRDREFRFCSLSCLDKFKADPDAFVQR